LKTVAIIGGGPSALMLAAMLDDGKYQINIYEKNAAVGRKFLVAGDGGFNLTHSEDIEALVTRYTPQSFLDRVLRSFTNEDVCIWLKHIGIETYTGSSKRIFPVKGIKPIEVLHAILEELKRKKVTIHTQHKWCGWDENNTLIFSHKQKQVIVSADKTVFALGRGSWKVTGSDGVWLNIFKEKGIQTIPFQASNCAYKVEWPVEFLERAKGQWLKNISVSCDKQEKKGELVITAFGLEGGAIYALSPYIREQINTTGKATIFIDFKPTLIRETLLHKISSAGNKSVSKILSDDIKLSDTQIQLLKTFVTKADFTDTRTLVDYIKKFPLTLTAAAPIDEAISTVGGILIEEVNNSFELKKLSDQYVIGEMLDWDAPTGGYLLQACFSMGAWLAKQLNKSD
jgi:uncharacterized flavoprotein (TIGR03862 family)